MLLQKCLAGTIKYSTVPIIMSIKKRMADITGLVTSQSIIRDITRNESAPIHILSSDFGHFLFNENHFLTL